MSYLAFSIRLCYSLPRRLGRTGERVPCSPLCICEVELIVPPSHHRGRNLMETADVRRLGVVRSRRCTCTNAPAACARRGFALRFLTASLLGWTQGNGGNCSFSTKDGVTLQSGSRAACAGMGPCFRSPPFQLLRANPRARCPA